MLIRPFLKGATFNPEHVKAMGEARAVPCLDGSRLFPTRGVAPQPTPGPNNQCYPRPPQTARDAKADPVARLSAPGAAAAAQNTAGTYISAGTGPRR